MTDREPIPARELTPEELEKAREVYRQIKEDTPENRRRRDLFDVWFKQSPEWQSVVDRFGDGKK